MEVMSVLLLSVCDPVAVPKLLNRFFFNSMLETQVEVARQFSSSHMNSSQ
jgi:hypothetical protein